jgi:hypothetical protein
MIPPLRPFLKKPTTAVFVGLLVAAAALALLAALSPPPAPLPKPEPAGIRAELQGVALAVEVLEAPEAARRRFGFDIRAAGLLPVRLAVANRGTRTARLNPPQTFLIDGQALAWPLLTADQARDRLAEKSAGGKPARSSLSARQWTEAAAILTGFALDVFVRRRPAEVPTGWSGWLGSLVEGQREAPENQARRDLADKFLRNPPLRPGESAEAYLFFPGREEVRGAETLRLAVEVDGRVEVLRIPLAPPPSADHSLPMAPVNQPRAMAR